ncbi:uncharacterized protein CANTADRAFT_323427 [Suhomyces tanzawaensis NRRL Y-17324]|uniref:Uncharacterized protein n=1 Tax=Suhomyces tanzawaensis NRRL Y-17324 TaxID=984487 RepID=A0A1E4SC24_9ASCO|nr:uncharacterized protein CANTADRAFT_323427 [Suhomyces tanzawaensis NRRL Y-17324]ODV77045.1 hypothetical protein CANTADRAFT_323427 [Suhomyces tanzawaensis NRRL Y-17324]
MQPLVDNPLSPHKRVSPTNNGRKPQRTAHAVIFWSMAAQTLITQSLAPCMHPSPAQDGKEHRNQIESREPSLRNRQSTASVSLGSSLSHCQCLSTASVHTLYLSTPSTPSTPSTANVPKCPQPQRLKPR